MRIQGNRAFFFICSVTWPIMVVCLFKLSDEQLVRFVGEFGMFVVGLAAIWLANDAGAAAKIWASKTKEGEHINEQVLPPNPQVSPDEGVRPPDPT